MGINVYQAYSQASRLQGMASDARNVRMQLTQFQQVIGQHWQAREVPYVQSAIQRIFSDLMHLAGELDALGADIRSAAEDIRREEEAARLAAQRAAEAAARQQQQQQQQQAQYARKYF